MSRVNELRLIARVAQMYHVDGQRQVDIAQHLGISQAKVSRMLKKAQEEAIVRTTVVSPSGTYADLETDLRQQFGLKEAIVVECTEDRDGAIMARIGEAAAYFVETTLQADDIIGVSSWSETIFQMVQNIHPMKSGNAKYVVQMLGGMGNPTVQMHANQLVTRMAKLTGAEPHVLNAPGVAQSREAKLVLLSDTYVRETMELFPRISLAIVGIGAIQPSGMLAQSGNVFSQRELDDLTDSGAVGDMSLRFFDAEGSFVKSPLDDRVIGMKLEDLTHVDRVIALAGGQAKTEAIRGALKTNIIDLLITDKFTARRLIGTDPESQST